MSQQKLDDKFTSRREFLILVAAGTGSLVLARCTPGGTLTQEPTASATEAPTVTPEGGARKGGKLRVGQPRPLVGSFDPALAVSSTHGIIHWVYEELVAVNEEYVPFPRLAESWEPAESGKAWTFHLREGVKFHHGREFVAKDVIHTFTRVLDPDFGSPGRALYNIIEDMEEMDSHTVRFALNKPSADFPVQLGSFQGKIVPYDLTDDQVHGEPRGTGPFKTDRYANADRVTFDRNPDYWMPGIPYIDQLERIAIEDQTTLGNVLISQEIDVFYMAGPQEQDRLRGESGIRIVFEPPMRKSQLYMNLAQEPFTDDRVRRAFKLIADRAVMTQAVYTRGEAQTDDDNPVIPTSPFRIDTDIWHQDLAAAKRLLDEAGYGDGLEVTLTLANDEQGVLDVCLLFKEWAQEAGVTVNLDGLVGPKYYAEKWLQVPFGTTTWTPRTTIDEQLRITYHSEADWNETNYRNPEFDRVLDAAVAELDQEKRKMLYAEIQEKLVSEGGQIIPYHFGFGAAIRDTVQGFRMHPLTSFDPRTLWLREG